MESYKTARKYQEKSKLDANDQIMKDIASKLISQCLSPLCQDSCVYHGNVDPVGKELTEQHEKLLK